MVTSSENITGIRYRVGIDVGLRGYRTKRVGFMVTFPLFGAEKSVLKLVGANLKDGQNVLVL